MDVTIIIPSYNTKKLLRRCLSSVFEDIRISSHTYEVTVVDNASDDGSVDMVRREFPKVKVLVKKSNVGYGKANNDAIRASSSGHILLLNSDTIVLPHALDTLFSVTLSHPRSFVGGKLLNEDRSPQTSCGWFYSLPVVFAVLFLRGDAIGFTRWSPHRLKVVDWVSGACLMARRDVFVDVGLFDEGIFMYMEEVELLYRARKKGYTCLFTPLAQFIHTGAASSGSRKEPVVNIYRGLLYLYKAHHSIIETRILIWMLKTKAYIARFVGYVMNNSYLRSTYEQALSLPY